MYRLLNTKGKILQILSQKGGTFKNSKELQKELAIALDISFTRVRDLVSEMKKEELVLPYKEIHGKYVIPEWIIKWFTNKHEGF